MSVFSVGGLSMQLPIKRANMTDLPPRKFEVSEDDLDLRPPYILNAKQVASPVVQYNSEPEELKPSDYVRASALREWLDQQRDDRVALTAWLEAFSEFNTDFDAVGGFLPMNTGYRNRSGTPCLAIPRVVKSKETRLDGSKRRKRQKVNHHHAVLLEPGDHWGPRPSDGPLSKTQMNYLLAVEASEKLQADVAERRGPLHIVKDKGPYTGLRWDSSTMSTQRVVQGFEECARPPTLVELWADHWKRFQSCPITDEVYEYKSRLVYERDESGCPIKIRTEVVNWKVRDGAAFGPTILDNHSKEWYDDGTSINHGIVTEGKAVIGETQAVGSQEPAQNQPDFSEYATPLTPLEENLETGTELVNFTAISMKDARVAKRVGRVTLDGIVAPIPVEVLEHKRYKQTEGWIKTVENARWEYERPKGKLLLFRYLNASHRTRYLSWLEEHDVHNVAYAVQEWNLSVSEEGHVLDDDEFGVETKYLGRELVGSRKDQLLSQTLGFGGAFALTESYWLEGVPDDVRYEWWHSLRGDEALAKARPCVHPSKSLQLYPEVIPQFMGPPCPARVRQLAQINIVDRLTYDEMQREKPITQEELDDWMESVAHQHGGGLDTHMQEFMLRNGGMSEGDIINLGHKKDPVSGIYVPLNMEIIRIDPEEILKGHINDILFQEKAKEVRERYANKPKPVVDKIIEKLSEVWAYIH